MPTSEKLKCLLLLLSLLLLLPLNVERDCCSVCLPGAVNVCFMNSKKDRA